MCARASHIRFMVQLVAPVMLLTMGGCATSVRFMKTTQLDAPITLSRLYVYSFLDLRTPELGPNLINELTLQLPARLAERGVATEQRWFRDDPLAATFARLGSSEIPIRRVIERNAADEQRFGSAYRLIAFPLRVNILSGLTYEFTWTLEDTQTNRILWSTTSHTAQEDGTSAENAKTLLDGLIAEMDRSGLFGSPPASQ
jgi:hypothetical protein